MLRLMNNTALGPKYYNINGIWALKPHYLGPWTLRVQHGSCFRSLELYGFRGLGCRGWGASKNGPKYCWILFAKLADHHFENIFIRMRDFSTVTFLQQPLTVHHICTTPDVSEIVVSERGRTFRSQQPCRCWLMTLPLCTVGTWIT